MTPKPNTEAAASPRIDAKGVQGPPACPEAESRVTSWLCGVVLVLIVLATMIETGATP